MSPSPGDPFMTPGVKERPTILFMDLLGPFGVLRLVRRVYEDI